MAALDWSFHANQKPQLGNWGILRNSDEEAELSHARTPVQSDEIRPQHFGALPEAGR
jgi:hypothetical protein